ncbi:MAG TPA: polysaccharide biosynthesis/export family protein, partial [Terriglobales bacterium]|nr:polysaccharide biosynthesis/export family protein [Terriglobales bacterium]
MRPHKSFAKAIQLFLILLIASSVVNVGWAQSQTAAYNGDSSNVKSRAEREAELEVALSPEKIIDLLRQEPGLLLEVKKMLVRKAYEQGRILDPEELTDDALFALLHEDQHICVLATQEIEARGYVRAKPTLQEIERQREMDARLGITRVPQKAELSAQRPGNQEGQYWDKRDDSVEQYAVPQQQGQPNQTQPVAPAVPQSNPALQNPQRQLEMTGLPQNQDLYDGMGVDPGASSMTAGGGMTRISPEQLPGLLNASASSPINTTTADGVASLRNRFGNQQYPTDGGSLPAGAASLSSGISQRTGADYSQRPSDAMLQSRLEMPRREIPSPEDLNLDRPQIRRRANPYANVPSLYDLYSQVSPRPAMLEHFGSDIFRDGTGNLDQLPMDLPAGPDYVLGPGDGVSIDIWGGVAQRLQRVVDPAGRLALPEVGTVQVSGRTLGDVQRIVQAALRTQFHEVEADVSLSRIRSVRVYVVGEVEHPGPYDISSLSTVLNALYAAGGPTSRGSLRHLRLYRGKEMVEEIDAYDLLLHGVHSDLAKIQSGDTVQVPPMGAEVTVSGMVMHPAIYELDQEKSLADVLQLAGGVLPSGTFR